METKDESKTIDKTNIKIFDNWALNDKDLGMEKGHSPSVNKMVEIIHHRTDILDAEVPEFEISFCSSSLNSIRLSSLIFIFSFKLRIVSFNSFFSSKREDRSFSNCCFFSFFSLTITDMLASSSVSLFVILVCSV